MKKMKKILMTTFIGLFVVLFLMGITSCNDLFAVTNSIISQSEESTNDFSNNHFHDWNEAVTQEAKCETEGILTYSCYCGMNYTVKIEKLGHLIEEYQGKEATCIEKGCAPYEECKRSGCQYTTYAEIEIDSNNHNWVNNICADCKKEKDGELQYSISAEGDYYNVTGIGSFAGEEVLILPIYEGKPVKKISYRAFKDCDKITSITIPNTIVEIGTEAFYSCDNLKRAIIGNNVTIIGDKAFYACGRLEELVVGSSVKDIGDEAFFSCQSLIEVELPDSLISIGKGAFKWCFALGSIKIGDSVQSIGEYAFASCKKLTDVIIGSSVQNIEAYAFLYCDNLKSVIFKNTRGWTVGAVNILEEDLKDFSKAANYLAEIYDDTTWVRK
ncbi:MAG: leucine-rich repeat domain-containing protein [Clostridia bacterium]|nr:leucine-rich repeat domain-containing protein [Clostridia bacterium]